MKMLENHENRARLLSKEECFDLIWQATIEGLNPDVGGEPSPSTAEGKEYCLASDVAAAQSEIDARLRLQLLDELVAKTGKSIPAYALGSAFWEIRPTKG
jgi:hypothetical protein